MKILIVDDVQINNLILQKFLETLEHTVISCTSGFECLDILQKEQNIDLVIIDFHMKDQSGLSVFEQAKTLFAKILHKAWAMPPFVLLTASNNAKELRQATLQGFTGILHKPFSKEELSTLIEKLQEGRQQLQKDANKSKILVIDPKGVLFPVMQAVFQEAGYSLLLVASAEDCLNSIKRYSSIKAVITDKQVGDRDCIGVYNWILEAQKKDSSLVVPPFILLSQQLDSNFQKLTKFSGFLDCIESPNLNPQTIQQKISELFMTPSVEGLVDESKTILIVDDVGSSCFMAQKQLEKAFLTRPEHANIPYRLITATSASEAIETLKSDFSIVLVVCDLQLGTSNAFRLFGEYKAFISQNSRLKDAEAQFILFTSTHEAADAERAKKLGFKAVCYKPIDHTLSDAVAEACQRFIPEGSIT